MDAWDLVVDHVSQLGSGTLRVVTAIAGCGIVFALFRGWLTRRRARVHDVSAHRRMSLLADQLLDARRWQPAVAFPGTRAIEKRLLSAALHWIEGWGRAGASARVALEQGDIAPALVLAAKVRRYRRGGARGLRLLRHELVLRALIEPARALARLANEAKLLAADPEAKVWAGVLSASVGECGLARQVLEEVVHASTEKGDKRLSATAVIGLAALAERSGEQGRAIALYVQGARLKRVGGELADAAHASQAAGRLLAARHDWPHALDVLAAGLEDARRTGDASLLSMLAMALAPVASAAREQASAHVLAASEPRPTGPEHLTAA